MKYRCFTKTCIVLFNIVLFCLIAWLLPIRYEASDDVAMCLIANGNYLGHPDCHLVFMNALYGCVLVAMYSFTTSIEWYTMFFSIFHIISVSVIVYFILYKTELTNLLKGIFIVFFYVFWLAIVQAFQFTTTSALLCLAGCLLLLQNKKTYLLLGAVAILIASLIRFNAAALVGLLFAPIIVLKYKFKWKKYLRFLVIVFIALFAKASDRLFYNTNEWRYYTSYNILRGSINDNPNAWRINMEDLEQIGITEEDFYNLMEFIPDPQIITLPVLEQISKLIHDVPLNKKIKNIKQLKTFSFPITLIVIIIILTCFRVNTWFERLMLILFAAVFIFVLIYLSIICLWTVKFRMFMCISLVMLIGLSVVSHLWANNLLNSIFVGVCLCIFSGLLINQIYNKYKLIQEKLIVWDEKRDLLNKLPEDGFVVWVWDIYMINPYQIMDYKTKMYPWVWFTYFPVSQDIGFSHTCLANDNVYFCVPFSYNGEYDCFSDYLLRKYDINTTSQVFAESDRYAIVQIKKK